MDEGDLVLIRAQILHDLGDLVPENYRTVAGPGIGKGRADWMLGRILAKKKSLMTERQALACQILLLLGLYRVANDALAEKKARRASEQIPSEKKTDEETELRESGNNVLFFEYQLRQYLTLYSMHLPKNKGHALTSLIVLDGYEPGSVAVSTPKIPLISSPPANSDEEHLAALFDPLTRAGIAALFNMIDKETWKNYFERAARNGLINARQQGLTEICYNPFLVGEWLIKNNTNCTRRQIDQKLANNLPRRSRSMKELFTGENDTHLYN
ncbi:hypothetical protein SAMN05216404_104105 [Nitrosospira multiformis]|uniref:Uncharacterized protein n=1 Tax=Nitrosospira multiformis TaxID=1231 RepID=A0A1H8G762_9PROT|nr:hypothetical protein [Nitrosospira multiformis]SEN39347.1 hypothetical protein SAMN05216404_104105 [Nitrosospira multiformis]